jgi:hypothetical protein
MNSDRPGTWEPSIDNQVQEVERQLHFLQNYTLPSQVDRRKITQSQSDQTIRTLRAAIETLRRVRDGRPASSVSA